MSEKVEQWEKVHLSCSKRKVFGNISPIYLTPDELDICCAKAGVLWEQTGEKTIHVHGCGYECNCHGGWENEKLRPRPASYHSEKG